MKFQLLFVTMLSLGLSSVSAAPQLDLSSLPGLSSLPSFNGFTGLINSTSNLFGSILPAKGPATIPSASSPMGCAQSFTGLLEGKLEAIATDGGRVRKYAVCFETIKGTCGIKFDLTKLMSPAPVPLLPLGPVTPVVSEPANNVGSPILPQLPSLASSQATSEPQVIPILSRSRRNADDEVEESLAQDHVDEFSFEETSAADEKNTQEVPALTTETSVSETNYEEDEVRPPVTMDAVSNSSLHQIQAVLLKETIERLKTMEQAFMKSKDMLMKKLSETLPLPALLPRKTRAVGPIELSAPMPAGFAPVAPVQAPVSRVVTETIKEEVAPGTADICHNYIFFPPTSDSFGGKVLCLDRVSEPSVMLVGTPRVVYVTASESKAFTIPFAYMTSC